MAMTPTTSDILANLELLKSDSSIIMDKKELLLRLIEMYGAQRESFGGWHVLGKCGYDKCGKEAAAKKKAAELLTAIENVLDGRDDYVVEIQ